MREAELKYFLTKKYCGPRNGLPLSEAPARDAASRGRRIERILGLDLDVSLDGLFSSLEILLESIENSKHEFDIDGDLEKGISSIKNAAKRYHDFRVWEKRRND